MVAMGDIKSAMTAFEAILTAQLKRAKQLGGEREFINYADLPQINIGAAAGDGIGPAITAQAKRVLEFLLKDETASGRVKITDISGLTIENRIKERRAVPADVLAQIKTCHVILKGPTTTPREGDYDINIESANVALRKELDLFANVRPVVIPELGVDWTFFRENTEGSYAVGALGVTVENDLCVDFAVTTTGGSYRIAKAAFEYARGNGKSRVSCVTKANVIKTTDGKFLSVCKEVAKGYPEITFDDWYIDISAAKLLDENRRKDFQVFVLPNLYGDILTDEAAQIQGGVGTAGSANVGFDYAMFEAIHGSAPRMVTEGRDIYADPVSVIRAAGMLLGHIGFSEKARALGAALDICLFKEKKAVITGRADGATNAVFTDYLLDVLDKRAK